MAANNNKAKSTTTAELEELTDSAGSSTADGTEELSGFVSGEKGRFSNKAGAERTGN